MKPFFWTLILLLLRVYVLSIFLTQVVMSSSHASNEHVQKRYGNLIKTLLTVFLAILDGIEWERGLIPLCEVSPLLGFLFCCFMAFSLLAVMNVITGVFVEGALASAQRDNDEFVANHLSNVLYSGGSAQ